MPVSPQDLLDFAEELYCKDKACETHRRSAVSRYYYAMYHKTLSILKLEPIDYKKGHHENLIRYLQSDARDDEDHDFRELMKLGEALRQERSRRNKADYELGDSITILDIETTIGNAEMLFKKADALYKLSSAS